MPSGIDASGRAAIAIHYAMAQVGKAYVYGAAGPNAFDCSGLTMMAWAQAGICAAALVERPVRHGPPRGLQRPAAGRPGLLLLPISHVGMYIGNGLIVEAANPGAGIRVSPVSSRCRTPAPTRLV